MVASVSSCSLGSDEMSVRDQEKQVVDAVGEAVPLAEEALGATEVEVGGGWGSCRAGGHVYSGGGTITAPRSTGTCP